MFRTKLLFLMLLNFQIFAQEIVILNRLSSSDAGTVYLALDEIKKNKMTDFTEILESKALNQNSNVMTFAYFETLLQLNSTNLGILVKKHLTRIDNWEHTSKVENILSRKAWAASILLRIGDNSNIDYIFNYLDSETNGLAHRIHLNDLQLIYLNYPLYKDKCIQNILRAVRIDDYYTSYKALKILNVIKYDKLEELCVKVTREALDINVKREALRILNEIKYSEFNNLIFERLIEDSDIGIKRSALDYCFYKIGTPNIVNKIIELTFENNYKILEFEIKKYLENFTPPIPSGSSIDKIINIIKYNDEIYSYNWITIQSIHSYFKTSYNKLLEYYQNTDKVAACELLNELLLQIEDALAVKQITIEGYKFLHYHTTYIKENIETEFGTCI